MRSYLLNNMCFLHFHFCVKKILPIGSVLLYFKSNQGHLLFISGCAYLVSCQLNTAPHLRLVDGLPHRRLILLQLIVHHQPVHTQTREGQKLSIYGFCTQAFLFAVLET